ncbi:MAG: DMT family transporter [Bosea sp. (in: a-proteobacteria)]
MKADVTAPGQGAVQSHVLYPHQSLGLAFALVSAACYGTNIASAQIAGQAGLSGPLLVFYRVALMLALVALAALLLRRRLDVPPQERGAMIAFGLFSAFVGCAYLSSVSFVPVTVAAVVFFTFPTLIVLAEPFVMRTPFRPERLMLALLAFIGVICVVGPEFERLDPRGLILALLASIFAAMQFFAGARLSQTSLIPKLFWSHVLILPVTLIILTLTSGVQPPAALLASPIAVAITMGGFLLGFVMQVMALARAAPGPAALAFCAEPVIAVAVAAIVLGERVGALQSLGGALVIVGIIANVILEQKRASREATP